MASLLHTLPNSLPPHSKSRPVRKSFHAPAAPLLGLLHHENADAAPTLRKSLLHQMSSLCKDGLIGEAFDFLCDMETEGAPVGPEIYGEMLQACVYERALSQGRQIHARVIKKGDIFHRNEYLETKLVIFYAKCRVSAAALDLFQRQRRRNVFSWAAMIGLLCREGLGEKAVVGFCEMMTDGFLPDNFVIPNALKACSSAQLIGCGTGIHGYALKMGYRGCVFVQSSLVDFYGKSGIVEDARKIFDQMPEKNAVAWNSMLVSYVHNGLDWGAMKAFYDMRTESVEPTRVTIASFLSASANLRALDEGRQSHAVAVLFGLELDSILSSSLINFYCKVGLTDDAELVFSRTLEKDTVIWNLLISGYLQDGQVDKVLRTCRRMVMEDLRFDSVTLSSILSACAGTENLKLGIEGHGYCIRNGLDTDSTVASGIIDVYAKCRKIELARQVFDMAANRDLIMWNTQLSAYANCGLSGEALKLFYQMQLESIAPNVISWNSVILGLLRSNQVDEAYDMLAQMQSAEVQPNLVTWTTLISGSAQKGCGSEAIELFIRMQAAGFRPNIVSILAVISACTEVASLPYGKAIYGYITRQGFCSSPLPVVTSLVDLYAKCGNIDLAMRIFDASLTKELPLYNAMISGYALHGRAAEALGLFAQMQREGISPDAITFTGLLTACGHGGLVEEGLKLFSEMASTYHVFPGMEHHDCVVTLLTRHGNIEGALEFISAMPFRPDSKTLGSLLAACRLHRWPELGEYLSRQLFETGSEDPAPYAVDGRWYEASRTRGDEREKGLRKNPGCSWIQLGGGLHTFVAGDESHPEMDRIYGTLRLLLREMRFLGYVPSVGGVSELL
ncbi:unnamed protein product [Spirodela intermedia]|uniref:Uncharacterized protein n=1 Tax=Spirodela intermedia TaxID=51605 RepID=A0A7I8L191_SPIIN|nr:unnamed protein product [Spirodela intermedia]